MTIPLLGATTPSENQNLILGTVTAATTGSCSVMLDGATVAATAQVTATLRAALFNSTAVGTRVMGVRVGGQFYVTDVIGPAVTSPGGFSTGMVTVFAGTTPPVGFLMCDGTAVSRTTYAGLYSVCGTNYGAGNGSTTFNVPNLTGRVVLGVGDSGANGHTNHAIGTSGGEETHVLTTGEMPAHTHPPGAGSFFIEYRDPFGSALTWAAGSAVVTPSTTGSTGNNQAHNTMPPFTTLAYIIKT